MKNISTILFAIFALFAIAQAYPQGGYEVEAKKTEQGQQVSSKVFHDWGSGQANIFAEAHKGQGGNGQSWGGNVNQEVWRSDNGRSRAEIFGGINKDSMGNRGHNYGGRFTHTWGG